MSHPTRNSKKQHLPWWIRLLQWLFSFSYLLFTGYAVFFARRRRHQHFRYLNYYPFRNSIREIRLLKESHDYMNFFSNLAGNFLLFVPYVFIGLVFYRCKNYFAILFSVFILSISIELLQYHFYLGVADIDDIILNCAGALAAALFFRKLGIVALYARKR